MSGPEQPEDELPEESADTAASNSGKNPDGTPKRDAQLSTMPRQPPASSHAVTVRLPIRIFRMRTCQYPSSGLSTGSQERGDAKRAGL
mmetsp:Transcript_124355/g.363142  ORF Transcript_124355/g.363142 Transcript_124355/m.363142 type:complete len:88 (-) Transcript_124355:830-1093(-)